MKSVRSYFEKLRHDNNHHLGLGDIRLTIGQQEEIIDFVEKQLNEETRKDSEEKICPYCHKYKKLQGNGIIHQLCECGD